MWSFRKYLCLCSLTSQIEWWLLSENKRNGWRCFEGAGPRAEQLSLELKPTLALWCSLPLLTSSIRIPQYREDFEKREDSVYTVSSPSSFLPVSEDAPDPAVNPRFAFRRSVIILSGAQATWSTTQKIKLSFFFKTKGFNDCQQRITSLTCTSPPSFSSYSSSSTSYRDERCLALF